MIEITEFSNYSDDNSNIIIWGGRSCKNSFVRFYGKNCRVVFGEGCRVEGARINFHCDNGTMIVGKNSEIKGGMKIGLNSSIIIGDNLTITRNPLISTAEGSSVKIGNDCMFAADNQILSDDQHPIFYMNGKRANPSRSIEIEDRVWLSTRAAVLSGSRIGSGSVIGFSSVAKGDYPRNAVVAGVPGKVVKEGVFWERHNINNNPPFYFPEPISVISEPERSGAQRRISRFLAYFRKIL